MKLTPHHAFVALALSSNLAAAQLPSSIALLGDRASLHRGVGLQELPDAAGWRFNGPDYGATVDRDGFSLTPFLGARAERTQNVRLAVQSIERGGVELALADDSAPIEAHRSRVTRALAPGLVERFDGREEGVELSYVFAQEPAGDGDLVVRLELSGTFAAPTFASDTRIDLRHVGEHGDAGGVTIGGVTGIDAHGATVRGRLVLDGDDVLFVLPDAFVDAAAYPLVLDPLVGPVLTLSTDPGFGSNEDSRPDVAYDNDTEQYFVVWERAVSANESRVFGRRFAADGASTSSSFQISVDPVITGTSHSPAVANIGGSNLWFVVFARQWESLTPGVPISAIDYVALPVDLLNVPQPTAVYSVFGEAQIDPDVCGGHAPDVFFSLGSACVVWHDTDAGRLRTRSYSTLFSGVNFTHPVKTLATNASTILGSTEFSRPSIARCSTDDDSIGIGKDRVVVAAHLEHSAFGSEIIGFLIRPGDGTYLTSFDVHDPTSGSVGTPDIDGLDTRWVCTFEASDANGNSYVRAVPLVLNATADGVDAGAVVNVTSPSSLFDTTRPAVGWSPTTMWVGWREKSLLSNSTLRVRSLDSTSCTTCEGSFTLDTGTNDTREWISIATTWSGGPRLPGFSGALTGPPLPDEAFAVWSARDAGNSLDIFGQVLANNAQSGTTLQLGGACGSAGTVSFHGAPSIGSSSFSATIANLPLSTALVYVNIATDAPANAIACGACQWLPFEIATTVPLVDAGNGTLTATRKFPIGCQPSLVGATALLQWTIVDPSANPCAQVAALSTSAMWRLTIGN
jgi:hypothetical protein